MSRPNFLFSDDLEPQIQRLSAACEGALKSLIFGRTKTAAIDPYPKSEHLKGAVVISSAVVSIIAGCGSAASNDGTGTDACFNKPGGIITDGTNLYVADTSNYILRKIVISTKVVTTLAGTAGSSGSTNGTGSEARFAIPKGFTTDGTYLYLADASNNKVRKIE